MPIRVMLVPSAVMPPSAISRAWTASTTDRHSTAVHGPTRTAASAPPIRCPLVPAPTGKLIIWAAKTNVATRPAAGAVRSSSSRRAPRNDRATAVAATTPVATEVGASRNPSGTCTWSLPARVGWLDVWWPARIPRCRAGTPRPYCNRLATTNRTPSGPIAHRSPHVRPPRRRRRRPRVHPDQRHRGAGLAVGPARQEGDPLLLPGRDDPRLHDAGLRLLRVSRL